MSPEEGSVAIAQEPKTRTTASDSGGRGASYRRRARVAALSSAVCDFPDIFPAKLSSLRRRPEFFRLTLSTSIYPSGRIVCCTARSKIQDFRPAGDVNDVVGYVARPKEDPSIFLFLVLFPDYLPTRRQDRVTIVGSVCALLPRFVLIACSLELVISL